MQLVAAVGVVAMAAVAAAAASFSQAGLVPADILSIWLRASLLSRCYLVKLDEGLVSASLCSSFTKLPQLTSSCAVSARLAPICAAQLNRVNEASRRHEWTRVAAPPYVVVAVVALSEHSQASGYAIVFCRTRRCLIMGSPSSFYLPCKMPCLRETPVCRCTVRPHRQPGRRGCPPKAGIASGSCRVGVALAHARVMFLVDISPISPRVCVACYENVSCVGGPVAPVKSCCESV